MTQELLRLTVYDTDDNIDYTVDGYQSEIDQELDMLDPSVEYNLETSPWNATVQSAKALSEASVAFNSLENSFLVQEQGMTLEQAADVYDDMNGDTEYADALKETA